MVVVFRLATVKSSFHNSYEKEIEIEYPISHEIHVNYSKILPKKSSSFWNIALLFFKNFQIIAFFHYSRNFMTS